MPFLSETFVRCAAETGRSGPIRFLDPFAGSGGVSRLARVLGYAVSSNDREYYAAVIARSRIVLDPDRLEAAFSPEGGSVRAFTALDAFAKGDEASAAEIVRAMSSGDARNQWSAAFDAASSREPYIARHYAPKATVSADWRTERLFYTAENACFIDRAREAVERLYPADPVDPAADRSLCDAKAALLDSLLYEAATLFPGSPRPCGSARRTLSTGLRRKSTPRTRPRSVQVDRPTSSTWTLTTINTSTAPTITSSRRSPAGTGRRYRRNATKRVFCWIVRVSAGIGWTRVPIFAAGAERLPPSPNSSIPSTRASF